MILKKVEAVTTGIDKKENWNSFEWHEWVYGTLYCWKQVICVNIDSNLIDYAVKDAKWQFAKKRAEMKK